MQHVNLTGHLFPGMQLWPHQEEAMRLQVWKVQGVLEQRVHVQMALDYFVM